MPLKVGRFQIREQIGSGATSSVYLADDPFTGRAVAIKVAYPGVFKDPVNGPRYRKMFLNEASLAGKLHHPHILTIHEAGVEDEFHYIVMEYIAGGTLEVHTGDGPLLPYERSVEIAFKCSGALDYALRQGVIHRDLKPANILVADGTDIRISDFGAALWNDGKVTQVTGAVGTPLYMAPEQIKGEKITHQADIYSLGVVLYQLLTGRPPFTAENEVALMHKVLIEAPPRLSHLRPDIPPALAEIVARALEKDAAKRYANWSEFSEALAGVYAKLEPLATENSDTRKFGMLRALAFFGDFTDAELWALLRIADWRVFPSGKVLIEEGRVGRSFFILATGKARVEKNGKLIGVLGPGDSFGEMAYIQNKAIARTATVTTDQPSMVIKIKGESLAAAGENLQLAFNRMFLRTLADRLARADQLLATL